jgi:high-affinity iron transporter
MGSVFVQSAVIMLREGLEALLVLAALAAYLIKADARDRLSALYTGAVLAIVASLIAAWVFQAFNNGAHSDLFEAFVILAAAALMLYVSGWLLLRQDPKAWQQYLKVKADTALAQRTGLAVGLLAFLAVFREGAETVLFVYALAKTSDLASS